jgi:hypothetical protein
MDTDERPNAVGRLPDANVAVLIPRESLILIVNVPLEKAVAGVTKYMPVIKAPAGKTNAVIVPLSV